jgi:hypothetical protein
LYSREFNLQVEKFSSLELRCCEEKRRKFAIIF